MKFVKAHCGANDFIILDWRYALDTTIPDNIGEFVCEIAHRHTGVGADGVIIIDKSTEADFGVRYFNPDGTEYDVCGNGALCVILYEGKQSLIFSTRIGSITGYLTNDKAKVKMVGPSEVRLYITFDDKKKEINFVNIGVPHAVIKVDDVYSININELAPPVRFHTYFGKYGTNVNFMQIIKENKIVVRSYERSVEGETLSCGSGSCACAVVGWLNKWLISPIELKTLGGHFKIYIDGLDEIWLEGTPKIIFKGEV